MNWNVAGTVLQSVTRIPSPKLHLLISYLLEDEFSFFSPYWINITIFICTPRISVEAHALSILLSLSRYLLMALRNLKVAASKKLLPRSTTSYSFWLSLSSCSYIFSCLVLWEQFPCFSLRISWCLYVMYSCLCWSLTCIISLYYIKIIICIYNHHCLKLHCCFLYCVLFKSLLC